MKVLYVEDNPTNVFLVKRVAKMGKHEIINYIDGDVALKKFDEVNPDLVLMDIQLAGKKTGLDVVKELRERGIKTPIIAVTAYAMVGDKERCLAAGCDDYMAKPLPVNRLVELFQHYSELAEQKTVDAPTSASTPKNDATAPASDAVVTTEQAPKSEPVIDKSHTETTSSEVVAKTVVKKSSEIELSDSDRTLPMRPVLGENETQTVSTPDAQNTVQSKKTSAKTGD